MIRNIWAVGRNYADHAKELGHAVPSAPLIFLKAGSTASEASSEIELHAGALEVHHEVELGLRFGADLRIEAACVALDLTDRPRQLELKTRGEPWTLAKSFKGSCPLSEFFAVASLAELADLELVLEVAGDVRQRGRTSQMIFGLETLVAFVREHFPVCPGDLLLSGTPSGVGPLRRGDRVRARLEGRVEHDWIVV
jgi:2-keto-4-pentenoate hydratase/2-oxohepta-3-ene-1,7-dioic acid hydratase in catechol pathway